MKLFCPALLAIACVSGALADVAVLDFEAGTVGLTARGADLVVSRDGAPQGNAFGQMIPTQDTTGRSYLRIPLTKGALFKHANLTAKMRAHDAAGEIKLMWLALDDNARPIFQRRFMLKPGEEWTTLEEPLVAWRWDNRFVGDVDEVREIAIRVDSPVKQLDLDDVRLVGDAPAGGRREWLLRIAFEDRASKVTEKDGLLVASDAPEMREADLERLRDDMAHTRAFIRRVFGDAAAPTDDSGPAMLLIFSDTSGQTSFLERLGRAWRVEIAPPGGQGYTVQDIATATYRADLGPRRPVYLHESVHAVVARDLRLQSGHTAHSPLQEGLASFVQVCVHPQSIAASTYPRAFAQEPGAGGLFKPLEQLFADRADTREYAQLASVVAWLIEADPALLRSLAKNLADGKSAEEAVRSYRTTWPQLQDRWLAWGKTRFPAGKSTDGVAFEAPQEFR